MCRRQAADRQCNRPPGRVTGDVCSKDKDGFCQETYEMPTVSWKYLHELEGRGGGVQSMCRRQAADRQCNRPAGRVTGDVCSKDKDDFGQETYELPTVSWKYSHELEAGVGGCKRMCRRQTADRQCNRPAGRVTGTCAVRIKTTFAGKFMNCPLFPGNIRMSWKKE